MIARCYVFMGARMHANIAALSTAVPVVALEYSHKTPGILRLFEQEEASCDMASFTADQAFTKLEANWRRRKQISATLIRCQLEILSRAQNNINAIQTVLDQAVSTTRR